MRYFCFTEFESNSIYIIINSVVVVSSKSDTIKFYPPKRKNEFKQKHFCRQGEKERFAVAGHPTKIREKKIRKRMCLPKVLFLRKRDR